MPRVYLKSWEGPVRSIHSPDRTFQGVYIFNKSDLSIGDGRTREVVLALNHTYTVDYSYSFLCSSCPKIADDFAIKILLLLQSRNEEARYNGVPIVTHQQIIDRLTQLDDWDFFRLSNGERARKQATLNAIKDIRCYTIEDAFSQFVESKWDNILFNFIRPAEALDPQGRGTIKYIFQDDTIVKSMVEMFAFMALRNPEFNLLGIIPMMKNLFVEAFGSNEFTNRMSRGLWLSQIYKALFGESHSYFDWLVKETRKRCGCILFKINNKEEGRFITSDNPAFTYRSSITAINCNGMYFPLTPYYLLFMGLNAPGHINEITIRTIRNMDIRKINNIIVNSATANVIATQRNLGYLI